MSGFNGLEFAPKIYVIHVIHDENSDNLIILFSDDSRAKVPRSIMQMTDLNEVKNIIGVARQQYQMNLNKDKIKDFLNEDE